MPDRLDVSALRGTVVPAEPLTAAAFAPFGDVVENPRPDVHPDDFGRAFGGASGASGASAHPFRPVSANQGSAIKYQHVSALADRYAADGCPSGRPSAPVASMFVCAARKLLQDGHAGDHAGDHTGGGGAAGLFPVTILERHPYTTQTFVPLCPDSRRARYLVIVAPTVGATGGPPDVRGLRAFVARGDQAVTYGAGTWHAPMAALGEPGTALPFFVVQFANGVGPEDCQEVVLDGGAGGAADHAVAVRVPGAAAGAAAGAARSKL